MKALPEKLAEQYADDKSKTYYIGENGEKKWYITPRGQYSKEDFLAGYKAAKDEMNSPKNSDSSDDSDTPDLQQQIEALQQYMTVAQRKIMALQANVEFLLYHNKEKIGESETIRRMQQAMQGFGRNND